MRRRDFIARLTTAAAVGAASPALIGAAAAQTGPAQTGTGQAHPLWSLWEAWRGAHLDFSGRVVDGPQNRASHSEGQGYGMLLAAEIGDALAFERMAQWTEDNLAIRRDALLAWRWLPDEPARVPDRNNASDGDLFYAWALLRAADRFGMPAYRDRAQAIAADLARLCLVERPDAPGRVLLLPAASGFGTASAFIVNPSYMMPRALRAVATGTGTPALARAADDGLALLSELAQGGTTPDWLRLTAAGPGPAPGFSFDTGYEALRVPLFLVWSGEAGHPALTRLRATQTDLPRGRAATVIDRASGTVRETSADAGYRAISALTDCAARGGGLVPMPPFDRTQPYYPATLHMFCMLALLTAVQACRPI